MSDFLGSIMSGLGSSLPSLGDLFGINQARDNATTAYNRLRENEEWVGRNQMQWRVDDLKKAGLNPLLATQGTPAMGGTPAMAPTPQIQGMGSSAMAAAQIAATQAQTRKTNAEARVAESNVPDDKVFPTLADGSPDWERLIRDRPSLGNLSAYRQHQEIENLKMTWQSIQEDIIAKGSQVSLNDAVKRLTSINSETAEKIIEAVVNKAFADMRISQAEATGEEASARLYASPSGTVLKAFEQIFGSGWASKIIGAAIQGYAAKTGADTDRHNAVSNRIRANK
jgi:hypothetical protein